jgi:hypothetical protein
MEKIKIKDFGIQDAVNDAIKEAVKAYSKEITKQALKDQVVSVLEDVTTGIVSAFLGSVTSSILKSLLKVDSKIASTLNNLAREPYETGLERARKALSLTPQTDEARQFKEELLHSAIEKFDEALTLSRLSKSNEREQIYIPFLQGLCSIQIRGGQQYAQQRFHEVANILETITKV